VIQATICESAPNKVLDEASFNLPDNSMFRTADSIVSISSSIDQVLTVPDKLFKVALLRFE
jgi:hypothetical protein